MILNRLREYLRFLKSLGRVNIHLLIGMWRLTKLPQPAITVFGGARIARESNHAIMAQKLTKHLASHGFSIITGGGPGIMEAANRGAMDFIAEKTGSCSVCEGPFISAGIGLIELNLEKANPYVQRNIVMEHFFSRKWLLVRYSVGFIVFPGGFGTMDELFEITTLIQCNKMAKLPVILIDKAYWQPLIDWIKNSMLSSGLIGQDDLNIVTVTDDIDFAARMIAQQCSHYKESLADHQEPK